MYFQITPYCEDKEEIESFPQDDKFFVGKDFLMAKKSISSQISIENGLNSKSIKIYLQNKNIRLSFQ